MKRVTILITFVFFLFAHGYSQVQQKKWSLGGYVTNMQSVIFDSLDNDMILDNLVHNRLNFHVYPTGWMTATVQLRNRLMTGETIESTPGYDEQMDKDKGLMDLTYSIFSGNSYLLHTTIDRLWTRFRWGHFETTIGRQRINWSHTFVWNPNDIFNVYSFFDFDYPEKPGSDALRLQYYPTFSSVAELAVAADSAGNITGAGMYRTNFWNYDVQIMAGVLNSEDLVAGGAWSGDVSGAGFRGEFTYFHDQENFADTSGDFMASVNLDYTFSNSLYLQAEALYSSLAAKMDVNSFMSFYQRPMSVKTISFSEFSVFAQATYPVTPLFNTSLSGMYMPDFNAFFVGPNLSYSLGQNIEASLIWQYFAGEFPNPFTGAASRNQFNLGFLQVKYNF